MLSMFYKEKTGEALKQQAKGLGVSLDELYSNSGLLSEPILQHRVREALNTRYAQLGWLFAMVAAFVSVISTLVALIAVGK